MRMSLLISMQLIGLIFSNETAVGLDCDHPCGPAELLSCASNPRSNPESIYNDKIFDKKNIDGYCNKYSSFPVSDSNLNEVQLWYINVFCPIQKGKYGGYEDFISAYEEMKSRLGDRFTQFLCSPKSSHVQRVKEISNLFATMAQETTSRQSKWPASDPVLIDGLYYRFEIGAVTSVDKSPCTLSHCKTNYFDDASRMVVAVKKPFSADGKNQIYTKYYWNNGKMSQDRNLVDGNRVNLTQTQISWQWKESDRAPDGYEFHAMTDVVNSRYWIGMGPKQLTGSSMMEFFGWYENNLSKQPRESSDLEAFIQRFLSDGKLAMEGGFFYWMYRVNGNNRPSIHTVLTNNKNVCHDIAITTRLINGGCNNYSMDEKAPGRVGYYTYFHEKVFHKKIDAAVTTWVNVNDKGRSWELNSMQCDYSSQGKSEYNPIEQYCYDME